MITGIPPTGSIVSDELLQRVHHDDNYQFNNIQTNNVGPQPGNKSAVTVYAYRGGPTIVHTNDGVQVNHAHAYGYQINYKWPQTFRNLFGVKNNDGEAVKSGFIQGLVQGLM